MDAEGLTGWLDAYGRAWETRDADAALALFSEEATYQETPFAEPMRGRGEVHAYWSKVTEYQQDIGFGHRVLARPTADSAIVHWWASFTAIETGAPTRLDGIFLLEFDEDDLCRSLREWWHADPRPSF